MLVSGDGLRLMTALEMTTGSESSHMLGYGPSRPRAHWVWVRGTTNRLNWSIAISAQLKLIDSFVYAYTAWLQGLSSDNLFKFFNPDIQYQ